MTTQKACALAPVVSIVNNTATALSMDVARYFERPHDYVLKAIRTILENAKNAGLSLVKNYESIKYKDLQGIDRPAYRMDRKGFVLLAMGFTGIRALKFKNDYIDAFDCMEKQLYEKSVQLGGAYCPALDQLQTLTPAQQRQIQIAVAARAQKTAHNYQTIYRALKNRFQVARYDQIPQAQFKEAMDFIHIVDLSVPDVQENTAPTGEIFFYNARTLSKNELRALANLIYLRELGKPTFAKIYTGLRELNSELAPRFYSLIAEGDFPVAALKDVLERNQIDFTKPIR